MFWSRFSGEELVKFPPGVVVDEEPLVSAETDEDDPGEEIVGC